MVSNIVCFLNSWLPWPLGNHSLLTLLLSLEDSLSIFNVDRSLLLWPLFNIEYACHNIKFRCQFWNLFQPCKRDAPPKAKQLHFGLFATAKIQNKSQKPRWFLFSGKGYQKESVTKSISMNTIFSSVNNLDLVTFYICTYNSSSRFHFFFPELFSFHLKYIF